MHDCMVKRRSCRAHLPVLLGAHAPRGVQPCGGSEHAAGPRRQLRLTAAPHAAVTLQPRTAHTSALSGCFAPA